MLGGGAVSNKEGQAIEGWKKLLSGRGPGVYQPQSQINRGRPSTRKSKNNRKGISQRMNKRRTRRKISSTHLTQRYLTTTNGDWNLRREEEQLCKPWGDELEPPDIDTLRIVTKNIGGIKLFPGNEKENELKQWINKTELDIIGIQEVNVNWSLCKGNETLFERFRNTPWEYTKLISAHNIHEQVSRFQSGGTITLARDQITHQIKDKGVDTSGLGRWSWIRVTGKRWHQSQDCDSISTTYN